MKRIVYRITPAGKAWRVRITGGDSWTVGKQADAVALAVTEARQIKARGLLAQVVLHGRDGRIRWERTYGRDPRRHRG